VQVKPQRLKKRSKQGREGKSECTFGTFLGFNVSKHRCKNDLKCQEIKPFAMIKLFIEADRLKIININTEVTKLLELSPSLMGHMLIYNIKLPLRDLGD